MHRIINVEYSDIWLRDMVVMDDVVGVITGCELSSQLFRHIFEIPKVDLNWGRD
jgi:hypothetical protein